MTLLGAKTIFLDTWLRNNRKGVTLTMVCVLLRETSSLLTFIMNVISVNFIACFQIICWFLQTLKYRGNEKYDKSCLRLTLVFDSCKTKQIYLIRDHPIMTLDEDQNLIFLSHPDTKAAISMTSFVVLLVERSFFPFFSFLLCGCVIY